MTTTANIAKELQGLTLGASKYLTSDGHIEIECHRTNERRRFSQAFEPEADWLFNFWSQMAQEDEDLAQ